MEREVSEIRATVGGTLVSRILGLSKWGGPLSAYFELTNGIEAPSEPAMTRGKVLESSVLALLSERLGVAVVPPPATRIFPVAMPHAHATVDSVVPMDDGSEAIVEAKTLAAEQAGPEWGPDGSDRIQTEYHVQVLWYHGVLRAAGMKVAAAALVPVLTGPQAELAMAARLAERTGRHLSVADLEGTSLELRVYRIPWDDAGQLFFRSADARVRRFIREHVEPRIPPAPTDADLMERDMGAVARGMRSAPGRSEGFERLALPARSAILDLLEANRQRKNWERIEKQAATRVQLHMGEVEEVCGLPDGARVTWKTINTGSRRFEVREPKR